MKYSANFIEGFFYLSFQLPNERKSEGLLFLFSVGYFELIDSIFENIKLSKGLLSLGFTADFVSISSNRYGSFQDNAF